MDAKKPLPAKKYLLGSDGSGGGDDDQQDDGKASKKRPFDAVDGSTGKDANGESNKKVKDDQKDDQKDGQKDGQEKKLNVPVDEGFPQIGMSVHKYLSS